MAAMLMTASGGWAAEGCGHECASCHKLSAGEAQEILKNQPGFKVIKVGDAPVRGLWEVLVEKGERQGFLYLDYSKQNIIFGKIVSAQTGPDKPREVKIDPALLDYSSALIVGDAAAKNRIAVFTDPNCPHCRMFHEVMLAIVQERKDIAFAVFLFPLDPTPTSKSYVASRTIMCERSLQLLDDAYHGRPLPEKSCPDEPVKKTIEMALRNKVNATPALVFPNGYVHFGALDSKSFQETLSKNLK